MGKAGRGRDRHSGADDVTGLCGRFVDEREVEGGGASVACLPFNPRVSDRLLFGRRIFDAILSLLTVLQASLGSTLKPWRSKRVALQPKLDRSGFGDIFVILIARENSGNLRRLALLIENKINAGAQPQQAAHYRRCGEHGLGKEWDDYRTVLVALESYVGERSGFQAFVSLESISDLICSAEPVRAEFRRRKLTEAIAKKNATGVQIIDPVMTSFRAAYHLYLEDFNARHGTNFWTNSPRPTYDGDTWVILRNDALPLGCEMRHKIRTSIKDATGCIEISFKNTDVSKLTGLQDLLDPDMSLLANGKYRQHVAIEIKVPEIQESRGFDLEKPKVEAALSAGERLWRLYCARREIIDGIMSAARTG